MNRAITIKDIARQAGVSETTVSLSFQEGSRISERTRKKVLRIAQEMNYVRNAVASDLRAGRTRIIGFIVNDITGSFYNIMSRAASEVANGRGYQLIYAETGWSPEKAIESTKTLIAKRVEGILLCLCEKERVSLELIKQTRVPHILVDTAPDFYDGPYVINDEVAIGEIAGKHLVDMGCSRIAFFNASEQMASFSAFKLQLRGFKSALKRAKLPFSDDDVVHAGISIEKGASAFSRALKKKPRYDGILCVNDYVAYGVMEEAEKHGIVVGRDLAVVGIDNLEYSGLSRISLTSMSTDYREMITIATTELIDGIESGKPSALHQLIEPNLVVRESSRLARCPRPPYGKTQA